MSDELHKAVVRAESLDPAFDLLAAAYAERLRLQLDGEAAFALQVGRDGLQLVELGAHAAGPIRVDFVAGAVAHRRLFGGGNGQTIAKAVGIQPSGHSGCDSRAGARCLRAGPAGLRDDPDRASPLDCRIA